MNRGPTRPVNGPGELPADFLTAGLAGPQAATRQFADAASQIRLNPENVRNGLAQLVLALVEALRELMERQAIRRIDAGTLTEAQIERMGTTFCRLAEEIQKLKEHFGFCDEDLNLDLGPVGRLR